MSPLSLGSTILSGYSDYEKGKTSKIAGEYSALQHYNNARQRIKAGIQEAQVIKAKGRRDVSDARVVMIGQGGTIDSAMLARIKKDSDMDAISAMYDAKADAFTSRSAGKMSEIGGKQEYRAGVAKLGSNLLTAASTYKWKPPTEKLTIKGLGGR